MDTASAEGLFRRSIALNQDAFQAGFLDVAYHALASALHSAEGLDSDQPLRDVQQRAIEQLTWIDRYQPEYKHSTKSTSKRRVGKSIYVGLAQQADTCLKIREHNRKMDRPVPKMP